MNSEKLKVIRIEIVNMHILNVIDGWTRDNWLNGLEANPESWHFPWKYRKLNRKYGLCGTVNLKVTKEDLRKLTLDDARKITLKKRLARMQ